jgi:hypothetical protein
MIADTLVCLLLVLGVVFGLSRGFVDRLGLAPGETVVAGAALSLVAAWLTAWAVFATGCPLAFYWALPALALASTAAGWRGLRRLVADPGARELLQGQLLVTAWCVGLLSFIKNHSGGAWMGDAQEHWQRALYFLRMWPHERLFIDLYQLPARPPLANVLVAAFLRMTRVDYAHFQVISTVLCSLAYLPVALLAGRFAGRTAARAATLLVMLSPLFVQNATYPWTKLEAAFFILCGVHFFLRVREPGPGRRVAALVCALCLGAAALTHYSAGPYLVVLAAAWLALGLRGGWSGGFGATTAVAALAGALVMAPWFAWSLAAFGWHGTFLSNSTVSMMQRVPGNLLVKMALNLRDSVIPPLLRGFRGTLFEQASPWGALRDQCFILYQLNLVLALGSAGCVVFLREAWGAAGRATPRDRAFWGFLLAGVAALSLAAYGDRDHYGTAHICLQSLVLLGLAFVASRWDRLGRAWKAALAAGLAVDFCLGIALQFAVEDFAIDRWLTPGRNLLEVSRSYNVVSQENLTEKIIAHDAYFSDILDVPPAFILVLLGAILGLALVRAGGTQASPATKP